MLRTIVAHNFTCLRLPALASCRLAAQTKAALGLDAFLSPHQFANILGHL